MSNQRKYYSQESARQVKNEKLLIAIVAAICGVGLGTIMALILTPKDGEEIRQEISEQLEHVINMGQERSKELRENAAQARARAEERMEDLNRN